VQLMVSPTVEEPDTDSASVVVPRSANRSVAAFGVPMADVAVLVLAGLLLVAYSSAMFDSYRTPRLAAVIVGLVPGLLVLVRGALGRDLPSVLALAFLGWAALSMSLSDSPRNAVFGVYSDTGLLLTGSFFACWALGRGLSDQGRRILVPVLIGGLTLNGLLGMLQLTFDLHRILPSDYLPRVSGTFGNPVFLGSLVAGGLVLAARVYRNCTHRLLYLVIAVVLSCSLELSGSRIALVAATVGVACALSGLSARRAALFASAVGVGLLLATVPVGTTGSAERTSSGDGFRPRLLAWEAAAAAVVDDPLLGSGPGRFQAATSSRLGVEFERVSPEGLFTDSHNVLIEYATTTGLVGLALLLAWGVATGRRTSGPLAWFAATTATTWLLQPVTVVAAPLVLLAFGAAMEGLRLPRLARASRLVAVVGVSAAVIYAGCLLLSDYFFAGAVLSYRRHDLELADRFQLVDTSGRAGARAVHLIDRVRLFGDAASRPDALAAAHHAAEVDPYYPRWWGLVGLTEGSWGSTDVSAKALAASLERYPWSAPVLRAQYSIAVQGGDTGTAADAQARLCLIDAKLCDLPKSVDDTK
jgi:hypothetical protein